MNNCSVVAVEVPITIEGSVSPAGEPELLSTVPIVPCRLDLAAARRVAELILKKANEVERLAQQP